MRFDTIRDDIHGRYDSLAELVDRQFPEDSRGPDAFKYALELYLRAISTLEVPIDGWKFLNVVDETPTVLRAVGISYVLPSSELPVDAEFRFVGDAVEYRILVGTDGDAWDALSESQRWKAVYVYATEGAEPKWSWDRPVEGTLDE